MIDPLCSLLLFLSQPNLNLMPWRGIGLIYGVVSGSELTKKVWNICWKMNALCARSYLTDIKSPTKSKWHGLSPIRVGAGPTLIHVNCPIDFYLPRLLKQRISLKKVTKNILQPINFRNSLIVFIQVTF